MPLIKTISHKGKIPLVSDQVLRTRIELPISADAQYDASTGDFLINRAGTTNLSNLSLGSGTFSYITEDGMTVYLNGSGPSTSVLGSTGDVGSYYTTTFIVASSNTVFDYSYSPTILTSARGQISVRNSQPNTLNCISLWGSDPISGLYQPQKQTPSFTFGSSKYLLSITSDHDSAWPNISNTMRYNGSACSAPSINGSTSVGSASTKSNMVLGAGSAGKLYEVIHYYRTLNSSEISKVENYLSQKWTISI